MDGKEAVGQKQKKGICSGLITGQQRYAGCGSLNRTKCDAESSHLTQTTLTFVPILLVFRTLSYVCNAVCTLINVCRGIKAALYLLQ